jgi:hypothetical protein
VRALLLALSWPLMAVAQPDTLWSHTYDEGGSDYAVKALVTADQGFVIGSSSYGTQSMDFSFIRTDGDGNVIWSHTYGTTEDDWCADFAPANDGNGWLMGGFTFPPGSFHVNALLIRVDSGGDTLWTRMLGDTVSSESAQAIFPLEDGGFLIAGDIDPLSNGMTDIYLLRLNGDGDTLWTRPLPSESAASATSLIRLTDGNFLISGSISGQSADFYFVKVTPTGDTLWTRQYGGAGYDLVYDAIPTADGGAVYAGLTDSYGQGGDMYMARLSSAGDSVWAHNYGGPEEDHAHSLAATSDGGYLVFGHTDSYGALNGDAYLIKTDETGNVQWTYTYGSPDYEAFESARQLADGGVILCGNRSGASYADMFLLRLDNIESTVSVPEVPGEFVLHQNYPNPFNANTAITFDLNSARRVTLSIYSMLGRQVGTLVDQVLPAGTHRLFFDAASLPSGEYIYRLRGEDGMVLQKKMILIK